MNAMGMNKRKRSLNTEGSGRRTDGFIAVLLSLALMLGITSSFGGMTTYAADPLPTDPLTITVKAPNPKTITVTWWSDSPTYRIYFGKGTDPKKVPLYKTIKAPKDKLGTPIKQNLTETITAKVEDNTTYSIWVEEQAATGKTTSQAPYIIKTPKWKVNVGEEAPIDQAWLWYNQGDLTATSVTFTVIDNADHYTRKVEVYCAESKSGADRWYVGSFSANIHTKYKVGDLKPDTKYFFFFKKGNSWSNGWQINTKKASIAAPSVSGATKTSAKVKIADAVGATAKQYLYADSVHTREPVFVGSGAEGSTISIKGLLKDTAYTLYQTFEINGKIIKSPTTSFCTQGDRPKPVITSFETGNFGWTAGYSRFGFVKDSNYYAPFRITFERAPGITGIYTIKCSTRVNGVLKNPGEGTTVDSLNSENGASIVVGNSADFYYEPSNRDEDSLIGITVVCYTPSGSSYFSDSWEVKNPYPRSLFPESNGTFRTAKGYTKASAAKAAKAIETPTAFKAKVKSSREVTLSWKNGDKKYPVQIEWAYNKNGPWVHAKTVDKGKTSAQITGLDSATTYYFRIFHVKESQLTSKVKTIQAKTTKTAPTDIRIFDKTATGFKVSWKSPRSDYKNADTNVYIATSKNGPYKLYKTLHGKAGCTVTGLEMLTDYYVKLEDTEKTKTGYWRISAQTAAKPVTTPEKYKIIKGISARSRSAGAVLGKTEMYVDVRVIQGVDIDAKYDALVYYSYDGKTWMFLENFGKKAVATKKYTMKKRKTYFYAVSGQVNPDSADWKLTHLSKPTRTFIITPPV